MADLFTPLPKVKELNKNLMSYIEVSSESSKDIIREWFEDFVDRDNKFAYEFQTTFESMLWELYCFAVLKQMKCKVDFSHNRPDFVVESPSRFLIECTVVREENGMPSENDVNEKFKPSQNLSARTDYATVRLLNSINSKLKKYREGYCTLEHVTGLPYIIAVAPFEQARFQDSALEPIRKILWKDTVNKVNGEYVLEDFEKVKKRGNVYLDMGIFLNDSYQEVSAILFSNLATVAKLDGMASEPNMVFIQSRYNPYSQISPVTINYTSTCKTDKAMMRYAISTRQQIAENIISGGYRDRANVDNVISRGYKEELTDGLHLFLNPFAKTPLSDDLIRLFYNNRISIHTYDLDKRYEPEGLLIKNHLILRRADRYIFNKCRQTVKHSPNQIDQRTDF